MNIPSIVDFCLKNVFTEFDRDYNLKAYYDMLFKDKKFLKAAEKGLEKPNGVYCPSVYHKDMKTFFGYSVLGGFNDRGIEVSVPDLFKHGIKFNGNILTNINVANIAKWVVRGTDTDFSVASVSVTTNLASYTFQYIFTRAPYQEGHASKNANMSGADPLYKLSVWIDKARNTVVYINEETKAEEALLKKLFVPNQEKVFAFSELQEAFFTKKYFSKGLKKDKEKFDNFKNKKYYYSVNLNDEVAKNYAQFLKDKIKSDEEDKRQQEFNERFFKQRFEENSSKFTGENQQKANDNSSAGNGGQKKAANQSTQKNYYEHLNISPNASQDEIRKAYFKAIKKVHPDLCGNSELNDELSKKLNKIYDTLKDEDKRKKYDSTIRSSSQSSFNF